MSLPLGTGEVLCKDGARFSIRTDAAAHVVISAHSHDVDAQRVSGLGRHLGSHEPGDLRAEFRGMSAETVRAYIRAHGGFADAGPYARASLRALPGACLMLPSLNPAARPA